MRFVIQRVARADVKIEGEVFGAIDKGFLVLIGVSDSDTKEIADKMVKRCLDFGFLRMNRGRRICLWILLEEGCFLFLSLLCMRTVKRGIVQALSGQGNRRWQKRCMNILLRDAKSLQRLWREENLARI